MFSKARIFFFIGVWVAILPYLGFPKSWKTLFFVITGLAIAYLAYKLNKDMAHFTKNAKKEGKLTRIDSSKSFVENKDSMMAS